MTDTKMMERRDTPFGLGLSWPSWPSRRWLDEFFRDSAWHPMFKIEECREGDELVIRAELPGVDPERDVQVEVLEGALVISADRTESHEDHGADMYRSEFRYGSLTRSVPLPKGVDEASIRANYTDGVLEVRMTLPSTVAEGTSRKVEVTRR
ncbi:MAG: Hsp20/alpha crystallin family protein [Acidimicrobiales bacterium]